MEEGRRLWRQLVGLALEDPSMRSDSFRAGSEVHRQKVRLWQVRWGLRWCSRMSCDWIVIGLC